MKISSVLQIVVVGASILFFSCVSQVPKKVLLNSATAEEKQENRERTAEWTNVLVSQHTHVAAPEGWRFSPAREPAELFRFEGPEKNLTGICTVFEAGFDLSKQKEASKKLENIYEDTLEKNYEIFYLEVMPARAKGSRQTEKNTPDNNRNPTFLVHGRNTKKSSFFVTLLKPRGTMLYAIEITGGKRALSSRAETVARILHSFRVVKSPHHYRRMNENENVDIRFHSFDTDWKWYSDIKNGMIFFYTEGEEKVAVQIRSGDAAEVGEKITPDDGEFKLDVNLFFNTRKSTIDVHGEITDNRHGRGSFSFHRGGKNYIVDIFAEGMASKEELRRVIESQKMRSFFERNLLF